MLDTSVLRKINTLELYKIYCFLFGIIFDTSSMNISHVLSTNNNMIFYLGFEFKGGVSCYYSLIVHETCTSKMRKIFSLFYGFSVFL